MDTTAQINYFNNLNNDYSETVNYLCNLAKTGVMDFSPGTADEAPDEFFYRLSDKSGKFMYSEGERHFKFIFLSELMSQPSSPGFNPCEPGSKWAQPVFCYSKKF